MKNEKYRTVQIPAESYEQLKMHCDFYGLKMGRLLQRLIEANCPPPKKPQGVLLKVDIKAEK